MTLYSICHLLDAFVSIITVISISTEYHTQEWIFESLYLHHSLFDTKKATADRHIEAKVTHHVRKTRGHLICLDFFMH